MLIDVNIILVNETDRISKVENEDMTVVNLEDLQIFYYYIFFTSNAYILSCYLLYIDLIYKQLLIFKLYKVRNMSFLYI